MSLTKEIDVQLKKASLRITPTRRLILGIFRHYPFALAYNDIENSIKENLDRVTIYRTLKSFEEKGIIHQVLDTSSQVKYALCKDSCIDHKHNDTHVHFECMECRQTFCVEDTEIPNISLPKGFKHVESSMLIKGVCKKCNL